MDYEKSVVSFPSLNDLNRNINDIIDERVQEAVDQLLVKISVGENIPLETLKHYVLKKKRQHLRALAAEDTSSRTSSSCNKQSSL